MKRLAAYAATVLFALAMVVPASAQMMNQDPGAYTQQFDNGQIDWQSGMVTAVGIGVPSSKAVNAAQARAMAKRGATVIARRNLLEIIKGVQIDSETTVQNYMVSNDVVYTSVRGFLQNSQILDVAYMSDGSIEVTVGINLRGGFANTLLPPTMPFAPSIPGSQEPSGPSSTYTGLLIDARGLGVRPAMSPKILDEAGTEVYGSALVSREYALQQGMAGYAKDEERAVKNPRIAANPLMVKAVNVAGKSKTDLVISSEDALKIKDLANDQSFLEKCKVMILLD